ncbi:hypothetical protein HL670_03600 [Serratia plymuthica]|uniref:hypothetical protein n=1 Tax=Serratia plymuthica TaxID=82996 RepID=UPI00034BB1F5|nr:hypothetical protein [Serratia plymuthica]QJW56703.1 hypothetical protein HL670_03600 [Serratia plymuthica]
MKISDNKLQSLAVIFLFLFTFSGVFSIVAVKIDNPLIKLWKEILIIVLFTGCTLFVFMKRSINIRKILLLFIFLLPFLVIYLLLTLDSNRLLVAYQIKNDVVPFLFVAAVSFVVNSRESKEHIYLKMIKVIIITGLINAVFVFFESAFSTLFMSVLAIDDFNNAGGASGVRLDNTSWGLRAMGTMTSFINSGTLTFFSIVCLLETKLYGGWKKLVMFAVLLAAMVLTTYKTTLLAIVLYFAVKAVYTLFRRVRGSKMIYFFATIMVFASMTYVFNSMDVYNKIAPTSFKEVAYNSIYLRVLQHADILRDMEGRDEFYSGLGVGVNGTSGPSEDLKVNSKALDSTYIYIMSNYGFIGVLIYVATALTILLYLCLQGRENDNIAIVMLFYALSIEFFTNNIFANFPCNLIMYTVVYLSMIYCRPQQVARTKKTGGFNKSETERVLKVP